MKTLFKNWLHEWFTALRAPWSHLRSTHQIVEIDQQSNKVVWKDVAKGHFGLRIPKNLLLTTQINRDDDDKSINDLVGITLPFDSDEVFACRNSNELISVLKTDIQEYVEQVGPEGQSIKGIVIEQNAFSAFIPLDSVAKTRPNLYLIFVPLILIASIGVGYYVWLDKTHNSYIDHLAEELEELSAYKIPASQTEIPKSGWQSYDLLSVIRELEPHINNETKIDQLSLQTTDQGLFLALDAQSTSAAKQMTELGKSENLESPRFVSSISSASNEQVERYKIASTVSSKRKLDSPIEVHHDK